MDADKNLNFLNNIGYENLFQQYLRNISLLNKAVQNYWKLYLMDQFIIRSQQ